MSDELLRLRVRLCMDHRYVWELMTADGHVINASEPFDSRDECIADAAQHELPIIGVTAPEDPA